MRIKSTTIWGAARDRFAEWAPVARTQDGSRSLPGSPRLTDQDIWSAAPGCAATDKSQCGSAQTETARPGREDVSRTDRLRIDHDLLEVRVIHPHLLDSRFFAWIFKGQGLALKFAPREIHSQAAPRAAQKGMNR